MTKVFVIYQSLKWKSGVAPTQATGPMEDYAESQSLMLARFALDGTEELRVPIVANATNFEEDNFPDHCNVVVGSTLLVSTGTSRNQKLKIRSVNTDGKLLETHEIAMSETTVPSVIGNSMASVSSGLLFFGASLSKKAVTVSKIDSADAASDLISFGTADLEENFPVGNYAERGYIFLAYIGRPEGFGQDIMANPFSPYLRVLNANRESIANLKVGDAGFMHVHPTVAKVKDSLFVAYSKSVGGNPQSQVVEWK